MAEQKQRKTGNAIRKRQTGHAPAASKSPKRKKPPKYTGWKRVAYYGYIALTVIAALIVVGYIVLHALSVAPDISKRFYDVDGDGVPDDVYTRPSTVTTMVTTDPTTGKIIEYEVEIPGLSADRKKEFYTFLLVGRDQTGGSGYGGNTDTMMLVAYDVPNQKLSVMSLPRDTYVRYRDNTVLLNSVYARGGSGSNGIKALQKEVSRLTGVYPDFYVLIQWEALGELVNAIGGVEFEVPFNMYYYDVSQHFEIDLKKGNQTLNGSQAMQLIRWRQNSIGKTGKKDPHYGYADGDLGRIRTQQSFMKAIIKKCLRPEVLMTNLGGFIDVFQRNVETDLSVGNMTYFAKSAIGKLNIDDVTMLTMPNNTAGDGHVLPIPNQLLTAVNENFNPYTSNIQRYELDLATAKPGGSSGNNQQGQSGTHTTAPTATSAVTVSPTQSTSTAPGSVERPTETEDSNVPLLPGGATAHPSGSPKPTESSRPAESHSAAASTEPGNIPPGAVSTPAPTPKPVPTQQTPADDEPMLPPGA